MNGYVNNFPNSSLSGVLQAGLRTIDQDQTITFVKYTRRILPYDGYVFWVLSTELDPNTKSPVVKVDGSLHYFTDQKQELAHTIAYQNVIFTTANMIADFNNMQPDEIYFGDFQDFKFSFSSHKNFYEQAGLWHYEGQAIYPQMHSQIIDDVQVFNQMGVIVSNSLPVWLAMNQFCPVYPSFLVAENIRPPYIAVHIDEDSTEFAQPIPLLNCEGTWQLATDNVKLVVYGFDNKSIQAYIQYVISTSLGGAFGIMDAGIGVSDGKSIQSELNTLAQQKFIELQVSYNQHAVYDAAIRYITSVLPISLAIVP